MDDKEANAILNGVVQYVFENEFVLTNNHDGTGVFETEYVIMSGDYKELAYYAALSGIRPRYASKWPRPLVWKRWWRQYLTNI